MRASTLVFDDFMPAPRLRCFAAERGGDLGWPLDLPRCGVDEATAFLRDLGATELDLNRAIGRQRIALELLDAADAFLDKTIVLIATALVGAPDVVHGVRHRGAICAPCLATAEARLLACSRDTSVAQMARILAHPPLAPSAEEILARVAYGCQGRRDAAAERALLDFVDPSCRQRLADRIAELALTLFVVLDD